MIDDKLISDILASEDGIKRADRWLYFGMAIALINVLIAGYVWMVKP